MIKVAWLAKLADADDQDAVATAWNGDHARRLAAVPGLERATYNRTLAIVEGPGTGTEEPAIDAVVCAWWTDRSALEAGLRSREWQDVLEHGREIFDPGFALANRAVVVDEHVMRRGPGTPWEGAEVAEPLCKHVGVLYYRHGMAREDASAHWVGVHGPLALGVDAILYYVQNHGVASLRLDGADDDGAFAFDGFSEAWFSDRETFDRAHESPEWHRLQDDSPNLFDLDAIEAGVNCVVDERVIKG